MAWLARDPAARCDPRSILPGARSVVCLALAYGKDGCRLGREPDDPANPEGPPAPNGETAKLARFARGLDYHDVVREKAQRLWDSVVKASPNSKAKICVDTSPILEKALARRAGIGWIGKHTVLVNEKFGSWLALGEIITDLLLKPDSPAADRCGDCRLCVDSCPAGALVSPRELDSRRCISYLTIEAGGMGRAKEAKDVCGWRYGCDLCQEACPYNLVKAGQRHDAT